MKLNERLNEIKEHLKCGLYELSPEGEEAWEADIRWMVEQLENKEKVTEIGFTIKCNCCGNTDVKTNVKETYHEGNYEVELECKKCNNKEDIYWK